MQFSYSEVLVSCLRAARSIPVRDNLFRFIFHKLETVPSPIIKWVPIFTIYLAGSLSSLANLTIVLFSFFGESRRLLPGVDTINLVFCCHQGDCNSRIDQNTIYYLSFLLALFYSVSFSAATKVLRKSISFDVKQEAKFQLRLRRPSIPLP